MAVFTTWDAVRTDILNKIATLAAGEAFTAEYSYKDFHKKFRSIAELEDFYKLTYRLEALENSAGGEPCVSYGRWRRFR